MKMCNAHQLYIHVPHSDGHKMANDVSLAGCFPPFSRFSSVGRAVFVHLSIFPFTFYYLAVAPNRQHFQCISLLFLLSCPGLYFAARDLRLVEVFVYQIMCIHVIYTLYIITIRIYLCIKHVYFMLWMCFYPVFFFSLTIEKAFQIPRKLLFIQSLLNIIKRLQSGSLAADSYFSSVWSGLVYRLSRYILYILLFGS